MLAPGNLPNTYVRAVDAALQRLRKHGRISLGRREGRAVWCPLPTTEEVRGVAAEAGVGGW